VGLTQPDACAQQLAQTLCLGIGRTGGRKLARRHRLCFASAAAAAAAAAGIRYRFQRQQIGRQMSAGLGGAQALAQ
jgi:hypothetical protein